MTPMADPPALSPYRLDELGWLQFERLSRLVLERMAGLAELTWLGRADRGQVALVDGDLVLAQPPVHLSGPFALAVVWVRDDPSAVHRLTHLCAGVLAVPAELGFWFERVLLVTNLDGRDARLALAEHFPQVKQVVVLGASELGKILDLQPELRATIPSVLGLRDLEPLIRSDVRCGSSLDLASVQELARVFWPTRAYQRARAVLARHRFLVLTGPPEMGKTAIARMLALAKLTDGWEAHECTRPDQVWEAFHRDRAQVFVADDAFGSTEYRADAAELWARELAAMLRSLDERHWLIWTSRPAPLKAGLHRVHQERGSERFPAPGDVLVDASELDLAEKTLILFRHAKRHQAGSEARGLLRTAGVSIVEHPHFTPERIRRFVAERLDKLPLTGVRSDELRARRIVERELAMPTEAMRTSFEALESEHRELLIALLDAPAGLIDERDLAATLRRHHTGGLRRPPAELIDRLTDHFLRITPLGIGWVHPSWRDLVIDELSGDTAARRRFLSACGIYGAILALSREGGTAGERSLPLLIDDGDWDALGDRIAELIRGLEDQDTARLLLALLDALRTPVAPARHAEAESLMQCALGTTRRTWQKQPRPLPVSLLESWYTANAALAEPVQSPSVAPTWTELHPARSLLVVDLAARDLQALDDWLALAQVLSAHDRQTLRQLGFYDHDQQLLAHLTVELGEIADPDLRILAEKMLRRIRELSPTYRGLARTTLTRLRAKPADDRWWVPEDIEAPPTTEPVVHERIGFTRQDVERVLADL
jgi:hypothetical protein